MTEFSGDYVSTREGVITIDVLRTLDALDNPLSTGLLTLIDISLNGDDIFASVMNSLTSAREIFAAQLPDEEAKPAQPIQDCDTVMDENALMTVLIG